MKIKNVCSILLLTAIPYNLLLAYDSPNLYLSDKKKFFSEEKQEKSTPLEGTKSNQSENKELKVTNNSIASFSNTQMFQGVPDLGYQSDNTTINYISGTITEDEIVTVKKKKEELAKISNNNYEDVILKSETIYYNTTQGLEKTIYLKHGYSTDIEFLDEMGNPLTVRGYSVGNKIFNASNPEPNILSLLATSKYKETNFNIRLEGVKDPIILRIKEGVDNISHTRAKIIITDTKLDDQDNEINLKTNILKELLTYGTLHGKTQLDYEVVDIARKETTYFEKKYLKIFRVEKYNKIYSIVLLDNQFEILGMHQNSFNRYQNSFNVYFLQEHSEIFTIMTKLNEKSNHLSFDFENDSGLIEKYRILIKE